VKKKRVGRVWISGVCDPYQPLEKKYLLTKRCLDVLTDNGWPFTVQTKSPLVLRDIEILKRSSNGQVGLTITTADERVRRIFEPGAPSIQERIAALQNLRGEGIRTFVMIAPILPGAEGLAGALQGKVEQVLIDRMNYHYADGTYRGKDMQWAMTDRFFSQQGRELSKAFERVGIPCQVLF
jgi:DNA repair photolyase